jgi:hypothetical protein
MTLQELTDLANKDKINKYPNVPKHAIVPIKKFKDTTANELTKSILTYIRLTGNYADRINNMGVYDQKLKKYRKPGTRKGICDIMASKRITLIDRIIAITVGIEIKIGKDQLSEHQLIVKKEIEQIGGVYIIAKDWDTFINQWTKIK